MIRNSLLIVFSLAIILSGCGKHPEPTSTMQPAGDYAIPVDVTPIKPDDLPAGKDPEDVIAIVTYPTYSIVDTPSGPIVKVGEGKIVVSEKPKKLREALFRKKDEPAHKVDVTASDPGAHASQPEVTPWWYWAIGIIIALLAGYEAIAKIFGLVFSPFQAIKKVLTFLHK